MDDMLTLQPSQAEDPFGSQTWTNGRMDPNESGSPPFPFDLHICDYSGGTPTTLPMSTTAATPVYAGLNNPFFTGLQPGFMAEQATKEDDDDNDFLGNEATYRRRALQRLSLTSSVVSSAPSTAPSETEEDANESDWDSLSIRRSNSSSGDQTEEALDSGLYSAFSSHSLAGPCSFSGEPNDGHEAEQGQNDGTIRAPNQGVDGRGERRGHHASALSVFNLADFISDTEQSPEAASVGCTTNALGDSKASSVKIETAPFPPTLSVEAHASNLETVKPEHYTLPSQHGSAHATPTRLGARFGDIDLSASPAHNHDALDSTVVLGEYPVPSQPAASGANHQGNGLLREQVFSSSFSETHIKIPQQHRSFSFNGNGTHAHQQMVTPERPLIHPSVLRVGRQETPPQRSYSASNIHDPLSCNPAYISPNGASPAGIPGAPPSPSPGFARNLFGPNADFPDSPASSVLSSPPRWATALVGEDWAVEDSYFGSSSNALTSSLSSSLPSTSSSMRSFSDACSVPASPSGHAGHPIRSARTSSGAPASPYAGPAYGSPIPTQHLLPPAHALAHLQDPYSGVITKRSRGRRVPSTPEEMTNIGKSGKVYTCKVPGCGKLFKRSEHLKRHIRSIHTNEKPYVCQVCLKQFSRHDNLNQHMRVHGSGMSSAASDSNISSAEENLEMLEGRS